MHGKVLYVDDPGAIEVVSVTPIPKDLSGFRISIEFEISGRANWVYL